MADDSGSEIAVAAETAPHAAKQLGIEGDATGAAFMALSCGIR